MDISELSSLMVNDVISARNLISTLLGYKFTTPSKDSSKAILSLFESFPDDIKTQDKEFGGLFFKYFNTYPVDSDNFQYYTRYSILWTDDKKSLVRAMNPQWKWEDKVEYKNSLAFSRAASDAKRSGTKKFLDDNSEEVIKLINKDKTKLSENFTKNYVWQDLIKENFDFFTDFTDKYDFNTFDVFLDNVDHFFLHNYITFSKNLSNVEKILNYLDSNITKFTTFVKGGTLENSKELFNFNVTTTITKMLNTNMIFDDSEIGKTALLISIFKEQILNQENTENLEVYNDNVKQLLLKKLTQSIEYDHTIDRNHKDRTIKNLRTSLDKVDRIELSNKLNSTLPEKSNVKRNKI